MAVSVGKIKIEGGEDLARALRELFPKSRADKMMREFLLARARPIAESAAATAPRHTGKLKSVIGVGTRLSRRQSMMHKKQDRNDVEAFIGASNVPQATFSEFGTSRQLAQPFLRPAWDQGKDALLANLGTDLWNDIARAAVRYARKK